MNSTKKKSDKISQKYPFPNKESTFKQEYFSDTYSIADISIWPWTARYERHQINLHDYPNVLRWYKQISIRPAVIKGYNSVGEFYEIPKP